MLDNLFMGNLILCKVEIYSQRNKGNYNTEFISYKSILSWRDDLGKI